MAHRKDNTADKFYNGNPNLKAANVSIQFTEKQLKEYVKCAQNPTYFIENYIKIVNIDEGLVPFKLYDFQKEIVSTLHDNRFVICKIPRQSGKSTTIASYLLHFILFNKDVNAAILANKKGTANEILGRIQRAYESVPMWLQQGVITWNKGNIELENGSKILASATSSSAIRGHSFNIVFLDEFAHVPDHLAEDFFRSVYPVITSGKTSKVFIVSTPKGLNYFYKIWADAQSKRNSYVPIEAFWYDVPGRSADFRKETIANTSEEQWRQEFECEFIGSSNTLIAPSTLRRLVFKEPIYSAEGFDIYRAPEKGHTYTIVADVARGINNDYSAFVVVDVTQFPYHVVAKYRNNMISPMLFPDTIFQVALKYHHADILIETNDVGEQVAHTLHYDLEYENLLMTNMRGRGGQTLSGGFGGGTNFGVKTSLPVKKIGCSTLKTLVEDDKLIFNDYHIISELYSFVQQKATYSAEEGKHDDLVMCLVLFSWLTTQRFFKELTNKDIRLQMSQERAEKMDDMMCPFGFSDDGSPDAPVRYGGDVWFPVGEVTTQELFNSVSFGGYFDRNRLL